MFNAIPIDSLIDNNLHYTSLAGLKFINDFIMKFTVPGFLRVALGRPTALKLKHSCAYRIFKIVCSHAQPTTVKVDSSIEV